MKRKSKIEISKLEAIILLDDSEDIYNMLIQNVFCPNCQGSIGDKVTEIINYKIYLESSNDVVMEGRCKKCQNPVARFIETSENPKTVAKIDRILKMRRLIVRRTSA